MHKQSSIVSVFLTGALIGFFVGIGLVAWHNLTNDNPLWIGHVQIWLAFWSLVGGILALAIWAIVHFLKARD